MSSNVLTVAFTVLVFTVTGCSTPKTPRAESVRYRTFSIAPLPSASSSFDAAATERLNPVLRAAIVEGLTTKGYREEMQSDEDFIVKVHTEYYSDGLKPESDQRALYIGMFDWRENIE